MPAISPRIEWQQFRPRELESKVIYTLDAPPAIADLPGLIAMAPKSKSSNNRK